MLNHLRAGVSKLFTPMAKCLAKWGVQPDLITVLGTVITMGLALGLLPTGHILLGSALIGVFALFDSLDGVLARMTGGSSPWGAFFDSTLDRLADGAIFVGITLWFWFHSEGALQHWGIAAGLACLVIGGAVPYARARAESVGAEAKVGVAERADRLVIALVPFGFMQWFVPEVVVVSVLWLLVGLSFITLIQRLVTVHRQLTPADRIKWLRRPVVVPADVPGAVDLAEAIVVPEVLELAGVVGEPEVPEHSEHKEQPHA